jgi:N-acetylglucosaminyl-diphospho-decaprenol L-rhamnosyltransferase
MTRARRVVAIIIHYGDQGRTIRSVKSHLKLDVFSEVIVVANDLCQRPASLEDSPCRWLIPNRNTGFGGACQFGATACPADVYAFFNAHVAIDKGSVERCVAAFDIKDVGIASPDLYYPYSGSPIVDWKNARCTRTYSRILRRPIRKLLSDGHADGKVNSADLIENDWATGAAIFCRHEVIRDIGWDGSYFLGVEDVDISMRAKKSGWRIVSVPSAIAFHSGESTRATAMSAYYAPRNMLWFARKYRHKRLQVLITAYLVLILCRVTMADILKKRRPAHAIPAVHGIFDGWLLWPDGTEALPGEPLRPIAG